VDAATSQNNPMSARTVKPMANTGFTTVAAKPRVTMAISIPTKECSS